MSVGYGFMPRMDCFEIEHQLQIHCRFPSFIVKTSLSFSLRFISFSHYWLFVEVCFVNHFDKAGLSAISRRGEWVIALACQTSWWSEMAKFGHLEIFTLSKLKCKSFVKAQEIVSVLGTVEWTNLSQSMWCVGSFFPSWYVGAFSPTTTPPDDGLSGFWFSIDFWQHSNQLCKVRINPTTPATSFPA